MDKERKEYIQKCIDNNLGLDNGYIKELLEENKELEKSNHEWFEIADNILRTTNKYGTISIGEVPEYITNLRKENSKLRKCHFAYESMTGIDLLLDEPNIEFRKYEGDK